MNEESKAIQEVAKTMGKFADVANNIGGFLSKVIGGSSTQVGGILEDWTRYYRYKNLLTIRDKVEALHRERLIEGKTIPIPLRSAIPMLEAASLEEDVTLQDIWAQLIANSMDPSLSQKVHPGYIEIVKQICPDEAIILISFRNINSFPKLFNYQAMQQSGWVSGFAAQPTYEGIYAAYDNWCKALPLKLPNEARAFLDNLRRLQLVELGNDISQQLEDSYIEPYIENSVSQKLQFTLLRDEYLRMTSFGEGFLAACIQ